VSEQKPWLHVRAVGMDLLLPTADLREVVAPSPVAPLPGCPQGIQGVVIHQGEFLPVLAWEDLPGCTGSPAPPVALAVVRPRLGIPIERIFGTIHVPPEALQEVDEADPAGAWLGGSARIGELDFQLVDMVRLIALLRRFRGDR